MSVRRFAATVRYDGTDFAGSQLQPGVRTVQGELERAARELLGVPTRVALAGRTDSGVHARGQVAAFSADTGLEAATVERALNALLAADVAVLGVADVAAGFDPRRAARRRWYRYTILQGTARDPLLRRHTWQPGGSSRDLQSMQRAAAVVEGVRDFAASSGPLQNGRTSVRSVFRAEWAAAGCLLRFDIEANAFLPQMVRRLVGAMERVGRGSTSVEEFARVLEGAIPGSLGPVAPPQGLCLEHVWYDEGYKE